MELMEVLDPVAAEESKEEFLKQFFKSFKAEELSIREGMAEVHGEVHEHFDALLMRVQELEASYTRQAHVLPAYDVQQYRGALKALGEELARRREELAPRKKFSFRRKAPAPVVAGESKGYTPATTDAAAAFKGERLHDLRGQLVRKLPGELEGRDVWLSELEDCRIVLLDRIGALHVHHLTRCEVIVAAVSSSAMLHHCSSCVFTLAVKQLRLHDSKSVALQLHSLSGPIIEHCERISFAPMDLQWPQGDELMAEASLRSEASLWSEVQDFNWLKRQASPNWRVVPVALRRVGFHFESLEEVESHFAAAPLPPNLPELQICDWGEGGDDEF